MYHEKCFMVAADYDFWQKVQKGGQAAAGSLIFKRDTADHPGNCLNCSKPILIGEPIIATRARREEDSREGNL